jgi:hypothetical protein
MTPSQALYGIPPPLLVEMILPAEDRGDTFQLDQQREKIAAQIKQNLVTAQERMKHFAIKKRVDRSFELSDMVYLKLQPYMQTSLSIQRCLKLNSKCYGPFKVLAKVRNTSYKLD